MSTAVSHPEPCTLDALPHRVAAHAAASPQAVALSAGDEALTYQQLNADANAIAHHLRSIGVGPGISVALLFDRSPAAVVAALAIWKAGGAYVPLDAESPIERLAFMLRESCVSVLLTDSTVRCLPCGSWQVVRIDEIAPAATDAPAVTISPDDRAYVIFTSGSTGQPKGVSITHASLSNLVDWHLKAFGVTPHDRASQVASFGFDAAVWEIWPYLAAGASVHMADHATRSEPEALRDWLLLRRISMSFAPTVLAEHLIHLRWPADTSLRFLFTGADTLRRFPPRGLPFALVNNYGPTECTVVATSGVTPPAGPSDALPSIGRPILNTQIYILDEGLRPVPPGEVGELHIGGAGLAQGYLNRPRLTREKFIPNLFSPNPADRLYKTGDLGRQLPNGEIAFAGRIDNQVKIRGCRVEPDEIAAILNLHPAVESSLVKAWEDRHHEKCLAAYVVRRPDSSESAGVLQDFLRTRLPEYMVPPDFVWLDRLPLAVNGKVDLAALPAPTGAGPGAEPDASVEERLSAIVKTLLQTDAVGRDDNFFLLGGHSLLGAQLVARIRTVFGVELTLRNLFEMPTIAGLSETISAKRSGCMAGACK